MEEKMIYIKNITAGILSLSLLFSFLFAAASGSIASAEKVEETAETKFYSDSIVIGKMEEYSKRSIVVNNARYDFCIKVIVFSPADKRISIDNIDAAVTVSLFLKNYTCVRKINVLRFAE
jgi:hypothetical protein